MSHTSAAFVSTTPHPRSEPLTWVTALAGFALFPAIWGILCASRPLLASLTEKDAPRAMLCAVFTFVYLAGLLGCLFLRLPFPVHFLFLYLSNVAWFRFGYRASPRRALFAANVCTAHLAAAHLLCLGLLSLALDSTPYRLHRDPLIGSGAMVAALGIIYAGILVLRRFTEPKVLADLSDVDGRHKNIGRFAWYAVGYMFFDTVPCMFDLPYALVSWFLIGSCLLLTVQWYIFLFYAYRVSVRRHWEREYRAMEARRAALARKALELRHIASIDSVTGAYTRAYAMNLLQQWLRAGLAFSLAYLDLDGLKAVNDRWGHDAGDDYLAATAEVVNRHLLARDVLARIGGDEFLVLMPDTGEEAAADRMATAGRALERDHDGYTRSFSYGVAEVRAGRPAPEVDENNEETADSTTAVAEALLRLADARMYANKRQRRLEASQGAAPC